MSEKSYHMTPEQFREYGYAVIDWIADYYKDIESITGPLSSKTGRNSTDASPRGSRQKAKLSPRFWTT